MRNDRHKVLLSLEDWIPGIKGIFEALAHNRNDLATLMTELQMAMDNDNLDSEFDGIYDRVVDISERNAQAGTRIDDLSFWLEHILLPFVRDAYKKNE